MRRAICRNTQADRNTKNKFPSNHAQQTVTMAAMNEENIKTNNQLHDTIAYHEKTKNYSGYTTRSAALRHYGSPTRSLCLVSAAARSLRSVECCTHTHAREREKHRTHTHTAPWQRSQCGVCALHNTNSHSHSPSAACMLRWLRSNFIHKQTKQTNNTAAKFSCESENYIQPTKITKTPSGSLRCAMVRQSVRGVRCSKSIIHRWLCVS